jgi:hypothetical protein|tara:strand:- start:1666 stop:2013 length:348 start_codon:yes stop_codon:yes gene_type:complete
MTTYKEKFNKKFKQEKDTSNSKSKMSKLTGIPKSILDDVYDRGVGAYKSNPQSVRMKGTFKKNVKAPLSKKLSKEQWAIARVYAFIMKTLNPREPQNQDKDLIKKSREILKKKGK